MLADGAAYATVTAALPCTAEESVSTTVEPLTDRAEIVAGDPLMLTAKSPTAAVVAFSASLYVMVSVVPFAANAAETKTGGVVSTVELFVTARAFNAIASLPTVS